MESWRLAHELEPGDQIVIAQPYGIASVERLIPTTTPIEPARPRPGHDAKAMAVILIFQLISGEAQGRRDYVFTHPTERIRIP